MSTQHNKMLDSSLCGIYEKQGGACVKFIGPLEEVQVHIPVELYWPGDQPTMLERLQQITEALGLETVGYDENLKADVRSPGHVPGVDTDTIEVLKLQLDEIKKDMKKMMCAHEVVAGKVDAVESKFEEMIGKVDAVESNVKEMIGKVDKLEHNLEEMKDTMNLMMKMMNKLIDAS
jgi:phage-related protein